MKTLKQLFAEHDIFLDNFDLQKNIDAVREWLTQKRQEAQENPHWEEAWTIIDNIYEKLLEETEK